MAGILRRLAIGIVALAVLGYVGVMGYIYLNQRGLQYEPEGEVTTLAAVGLTRAEPVAIATSGGAMVNGLYQAPSPGQATIFYLKGNAGSFSKEHERFSSFVADGYGFLAFDYRGFPLSEGEISQAIILADALAAFDWLAGKPGPIVIWGRSLGSGPASYVASQRQAEALILETPFLSAVDVAADRYWYLPVGLLMSDQYPVKEWMKTVDEPLFVAHGTADQTIGVSHGERVYALAKHPMAMWIEPGAGHSDLWKAGLWTRAKAFITAEELAAP